MSATAVLVPVLESEVKALVAPGGPSADAQGRLLERARTLRERVARVDAVREELHDLFFPKWKGPNERPPGFMSSLTSYFRKHEPAAVSKGYDPFVHLFGRSLPVAAPDSPSVAQRLSKLLTMDDASFQESLGSELALLDPSARALWTNAPRAASEAPFVPTAVSAQMAALSHALRKSPPDFTQALDIVVRLSAWSRPIWRFDGEMLPDLVRTLDLNVEWENASDLFTGVFDPTPQRDRALSRLPKALDSFDGAGAWLSSTQVKFVANALRIQKRRLADTASYAQTPALVMRHMRLLEEAVFFCEANGLALSEAAGVEWHDRRNTPGLSFPDETAAP